MDKRIRAADGGGRGAAAGTPAMRNPQRRSPPHAREAATASPLQRQLRRTRSSTAAAAPAPHGRRAAAEVGPRLRRRLRRPAAPLVGERAPLEPRLAGQVVVRVVRARQGAERGIGDARVRGARQLRQEEAAREGLLQGHIPRERGGVAQTGRRRGLGGCVRRAGVAWLHGPPAIEVTSEFFQRSDAREILEFGFQFVILSGFHTPHTRIND